MCDPTTCPERGRCVQNVRPHHDPRQVRACVCDPEADELAALMATGVDQWTASLGLWAPEVLAERDDEREAS